MIYYQNENKDQSSNSKTFSANIRPIEEKDNEYLAKLIRETFEEFDAPKEGTVYSDPRTDILYQFFKHPESEYWVVEYNNKIVGGCGFYPTEGLPTACAEVVKLYLSPTIRGKGLGSYLINMIEERARNAGYRQLYIESFSFFQSAIYLYEKMGYKYLKSPLGNSGHSATTIHMLKDIMK